MIDSLGPPACPTADLHHHMLIRTDFRTNLPLFLSVASCASLASPVLFCFLSTFVSVMHHEPTATDLNLKRPGSNQYDYFSTCAVARWTPIFEEVQKYTNKLEARLSIIKVDLL